ncbi:Golgin-45 [Geodia barretti]|nr:Golgin-45 [Geodia barretti]
MAAERERGCERSDSCSESDSMSRRSSSSQLDPRLSPPLELKSNIPHTSVRPFHHSRAPLAPSLSMPPLIRNHTLGTRQSTEALDMSELEFLLQAQREVNRELKRLLVASVGSDLELRLEQILQEKAELSQDLSLSLQHVASNHEELDQVAIECDIWRSKFIASRVMIDELASWKAELSLQLRETHKALQYMLHEREDIGHELLESHAHLERALTELERLKPRACSNHLLGAANVAAVSPVQSYASSGPSLADDSANATVLDLAHGNTVASRDLASQLSRVTTGKSDDGNRSVAASVPRVMKPTAGERLAHRVVNYRGNAQRTNRETTPPLPNCC